MNYQSTEVAVPQEITRTEPIDRPILRVLNVETSDLPAFLRQIEEGREIYHRIGVEAHLRVWQATYAGPDTNKILVTLEFSDADAFSRSRRAYARAAGTPEYDAWVARSDEIRTVTYDALHAEL